MSRKRRAKIIIPFVAPALLVYIVFFVYPAVQALWVSFNEWSGFVPQMKFVGFNNFKELLKDDMFLQSLRNTLIITFAGGAIVIGLALFFAGILSRKNLKGSKLIRSIIFYPNVVPAVGLGVLWVFMYNNDFGLINGILKLFGLSSLSQTWLDPSWALTSVIAAMIWTYVGFYLVILLSGINKIPPSLYEAAEMEGAGHWNIFNKITIPLIWDSLNVVVLLWFINSFKAFDLIYAMTEGGPSGSTQTISIYLYDVAFGRRVAIFRMGYGTAMAVILLVLVVIGTTVYRLSTRRERIEF